MQERRKKFRRQPEHLTSSRLTAIDIAIVNTVMRYGLLTSSLLVRLLHQFNEDVVYRHLRNLYDRELLNRFVLPRSVGPHTEFTYYADNPRVIDVLIELGGMRPEELDRETVWRNREKAYHEFMDPAKSRHRLGSLFYIEHELMLSRFHDVSEVGRARRVE